MFRIRSFFKELEPTRQMSEAFRNCIFLALSGGFQDAYTYFTRDEVFSNAQTGNVVLMSQHFMLGEWQRGLHYLIPLLAFAGGVFFADCVQGKFKYANRLHWRQGILLLEILILFGVGFIPQDYNMLATTLVSFSCAMQVQSFRKVGGYSYASTMCIGNLRSGTAALSAYMRDRRPEQIRQAMYYFGIILFFAVGAGIGGNLSMRLGFKAIWFSSAVLAVSFLLMFIEEKEKSQLIWLEKILENSQKCNHRILFGHYPFFVKESNEANRYENIPLEKRKTYLDLMSKYRVSNMFAGHLHYNAMSSYEDFNITITNSICTPLGKDRIGIRIIKVYPDKVVHDYYDLEQIPSDVVL